MLKDILRRLRVESEKTQDEIAALLNIQRSSYTRYESGLIKPDYSAIIKLADYYDVSVDYLLERKNEAEYTFTEKRLIRQYRKASDYARKAALFLLDSSSGSNDIDIGSVKTYDIDDYRDYPVSAGTGNWIDDAQKETLVLKKEPPAGACYVCRVSGDSMQPLFDEGDRIFVSVEPVSVGGIGIFIYNNEAFIKRAGKGCLLSENPAYPPIIIHESDSLFCIGTVLGKVNKDDIIKA